MPLFRKGRLAMVRILKIMDRISICSGKLCAIPLFLVIFVVLYEVIARYCFNSPTQWANELMLMGCAFVYLAGGAWVLQSDKHIRMELLYDKLSERGKALMDLATSVFFFLYLGLFILVSGNLAWESLKLKETTGSSWDPPFYPIKIIFALSVILLVLQGVSNFLKNAYFLLKGKRP